MAEQRDNALLLRTIPYSESSLILHVLTEHKGRISLMARGARRAKNPFRAGLMPLHHLNVRWREPRTGSMGTLIEVQRISPLLPEVKMLAGQTLLANAAALFHDGDAHGYQELSDALSLLATRPDESGICAGTWRMLESSGWIGDFAHCWHCHEDMSLDNSGYWRQGHLLCNTCANGQGHQLSSGFRKTIAGHMNIANVTLNQEHIRLWQLMIKDTFKTQQIYPKG